MTSFKDELFEAIPFGLGIVLGILGIVGLVESSKYLSYPINWIALVIFFISAIFIACSIILLFVLSDNKTEEIKKEMLE